MRWGRNRGKTLLLNLQKYEQEHGMTVNREQLLLQGAVFALEYYATTDPFRMIICRPSAPGTIRQIIMDRSTVQGKRIWCRN